jgi:hypothetical protein
LMMHLKWPSKLKFSRLIPGNVKTWRFRVSP